MLSKVIKGAILKRKLTIFLVVFVLIQGLLSFNTIPMNENPQLDIPAAVVTTIYPGASADEVDRMVTKKIEDASETVNNFDYSMSTSIPSVSSVIVVSKYGVDYDEVWAELSQKLSAIQSELPENCQDIVIDTELMDTAGAILAISDNTANTETLESYSRILKNQLEGVNGIKRVEILGTQDKQVTVEVNSANLDMLSVDMRDVGNIIASSAVSFPLGKLEDGGSKLNLVTQSELKSLHSLKNLVVSISDQGVVKRLGDISKVAYDNKISSRVYTNNGDHTYLIACYFDNTLNTVKTGAKVNQVIRNYENSLPDSLKVTKVLFQPDDIQASVQSFILSLLQGVILVIIVVLIGMGSRNALIVSLAIPTSLAITFAVMQNLDVKIHQISIAALIISLGMLVDNAIVVIDSIQNRLDDGSDKLEACVNGTGEVAIPVLTSTLTTVFAFSPLLLIQTITGDYIKSLPLIVITALVASYLTAIFLTPTLSFMLLKPSLATAARRKGWIRLKFGQGLRFCLSKPALVYLALVILLVGSGYIGNILSPQFFPKEDKNIIYANITTDDIVDIEYTSKEIGKVVERLEEESGIDMITAAIGGVLPKFNDTIPVQIDSVNRAQLLLRVNLENAGLTSNSEYVRYLQSKYTSMFTALNVEFLEIEKGEPVGAPVSVRILSDDLEKAIAAKQEVKEIIESVMGVTDVKDDLLPAEYNLMLDIDNDKASLYGLSKYEIQNELNLALSGRRISSIHNKGKSADVFLKSDINEKREVERYKVKSSITGKKAIVKQFSEVVLEESRPRILKYDGQYSVLITAQVLNGYNAIRIQKQIGERLSTTTYTDVSIEMEGEAKRLDDSFGDVSQAAILAIAAVFMVLFVQFYSYTQPVIILLTVPLSLIGSIFGLYIFKQPLSFTAILGIVSLIGIVVNNAIVLIDYINLVKNDGNSILESCRMASLKRLRPIMLSTITTVTGLIPLIMTRSELFTPMAVALMSGLLFSMGLTLIVIPVVYYRVHKVFFRME